MANLRHARSKKAGLSPGTIMYVGEPRARHPQIRLVRYNNTTVEEEVISSFDANKCLPKPGFITWIDIDGIHDVDFVDQIGKAFNLHPLVLEDIVNTTKRPKIEQSDGYLFTLLKSAHPNRQHKRVITEQVSLVLLPGVVLTFQEQNLFDIFKPLRERLQSENSRLRKNQADYLAYALIDSIIDSFFGGLEILGEKLDRLEKEAVNHSNEKTIREIYKAKRLSLHLRRSIWPIREMMSGLLREESKFFTANTMIFMRDVYDHVVELIDIIEADRDMCAGLMEIYLSGISNRMNSVMVVLAMVSTIFMPLSFIAGLYGMNFKHMPELDWPMGYPAVLIFMALVAASMLLFFKRRGWI